MPTESAADRPAVVLVVSPHEWTSRALETILAPAAYTVLKSHTARAALVMVQHEQPDVIIVDSQLPDRDGLDLCRQLRVEALVTPSTPVLMTMPAVPTRRDRLRALEAGAWDCLGQPLDADEVVALLRALVPAKLDADRARGEGFVDEETGFYNVQGLTRRAHELAALASRRRMALACVMLAPDAGLDDASAEVFAAVQRRIAHSLKSAGRACDAIGRLGPTAFAVVGVGTDAVQARKLAERLASAILAVSPAAPDAAPLFRLHAGCDGISALDDTSIDPVELMLHATAALQRARSDPDGGWIRSFDEAAASS
jgi:PleD family two-component response regulator